MATIEKIPVTSDFSAMENTIPELGDEVKSGKSSISELQLKVSELDSSLLELESKCREVNNSFTESLYSQIKFSQNQIEINESIIKQVSKLCDAVDEIQASINKRITVFGWIGVAAFIILAICMFIV